MPSSLRRLLVLAIATALVSAHAESDEASLIAEARSGGSNRVTAIGELGRRQPTDAAAVAAVLIDGVLDESVLVTMQARNAIRDLLRDPEESSALATALVVHADRLVAGAARSMTELTNEPLEVLALLSLPSATYGDRLTALLDQGSGHRRYAMATLANCRPLTPAIRRRVLAMVDSPPLVQQDLAIALGRWPVEELAHPEVDEALARLFDAVMGNVPGWVIEVATRRGVPSPRLAERLQAIIADPTTDDRRYESALKALAVCGVERWTLLGRLLAVDPRQDPHRFCRVLRHLRDGDVPPAIAARAAEILGDAGLPWWTRHDAADVLDGLGEAGGAAALVAEFREIPGWLSWVDMAVRDGKDIDQHLARATTEEERLAWNVAKHLVAALAAQRDQSDFVRREGGIRFAALQQWTREHPETALHPWLVARQLHAIQTMYEMSDAERAAALAFVRTVAASPLLVSPVWQTARAPYSGPEAIRIAVVSALDLLHADRSRRERKPEEPSELSARRLQTVRLLRDAKAEPLLVLHAERELAASIRAHLREHRLDPGLYRGPLRDCGFAAMPIEEFLAETARPYRPAPAP